MPQIHMHVVHAHIRLFRFVEIIPAATQEGVHHGGLSREHLEKLEYLFLPLGGLVFKPEGAVEVLPLLSAWLELPAELFNRLV